MLLGGFSRLRNWIWRKLCEKKTFVWRILTWSVVLEKTKRFTIWKTNQRLIWPKNYKPAPNLPRYLYGNNMWANGYTREDADKILLLKMFNSSFEYLSVVQAHKVKIRLVSFNIIFAGKIDDFQDDTFRWKCLSVNDDKKFLANLVSMRLLF